MSAIAISTRGRKGPLSPRIVVPLVPPPPPPPAPAIAYDESNVTVTWPAVGALAPVQAPTDAAATDVLPSTPIEATRPAIAYNVYDTTNPAAGREADEDADRGAAIPGCADRVGRETLLHRAHGGERRRVDDRERRVAGAVRDAGRHVRARRAERRRRHSQRGRDQPDLGAEQREGSRRLHRDARRGARRDARADHAGADPGDVVQGRRAARRAVRLRRARRWTRPAT